MNENTLILTEHRVLPRLVDAGLTLLAWLGFLFFLYANLLMQFIAPPSPRWESLMDSLNTALVYYKYTDDIKDGDRGRGKRLWFVSGHKRAAREYPEIERIVRDNLAAQEKTEKAGADSLDRAADAFAALLSGAAQEVDEPVRRRVLAQLLYHLGRWIYLTDAADDLAKDQRSGSYNPLPLRFSVQEGKLTEESRQELAQTMDRSVERMAAAFELLECGVWQPVIESVVYAGLYQVGNAVLNGTFHQRPRREKYPERKAGHGDA